MKGWHHPHAVTVINTGCIRNCILIKWNINEMKYQSEHISVEFLKGAPNRPIAHDQQIHAIAY